MVDNFTPEDQQAGAYIDGIERLRDPSHVHCLSQSEWKAGFAEAGFALLKHEIYDKSMEFAIEAQLRSLFLDAPPSVVEFIRPTVAGEDIHFVLQEVILIGRKAA